MVAWLKAAAYFNVVAYHLTQIRLNQRRALLLYVGDEQCAFCIRGTVRRCVDIDHIFRQASLYLGVTVPDGFDSNGCSHYGRSTMVSDAATEGIEASEDSDHTRRLHRPQNSTQPSLQKTGLLERYGVKPSTDVQFLISSRQVLLSK